ncbi:MULTISPECIES: hypothetical protein [Streptomyces]|jgi:RND superfamily putative drug exporter|uniref:hypothetical protein n=1 Tax=Streptomyces TaxID=1883 RepID=UPI000A39C03F|nr:hypothetical protein [Streptomyces glaucescens]
MRYATGGVVLLKELGVGTAVTVLVDVTLIRAVLLPVTMRPAGRADWWAPRPLRRMRLRGTAGRGRTYPVRSTCDHLPEVTRSAGSGV